MTIIFTQETSARKLFPSEFHTKLADRAGGNRTLSIGHRHHYDHVVRVVVLWCSLSADNPYSKRIYPRIIHCFVGWMSAFRFPIFFAA